MNNYKEILLHRLHRTINEKNKIENGSVRLLTYDITIEPEIVQLDKKNSVICSIYFYVKAPLFDNVFFESSFSIAPDEYKAIETASDNFVYCALQGILDFLSGVYHHEIETSILNAYKNFTVCESPIIGIGNIKDKEDFYEEYVKFSHENGYYSVFWNAVYKEVPFMLANNRVSFIKVYGAKMPNGEIIVECNMNNVVNKTLENCIQNEIIKWDNEGEFFSIKQFFFILQSDTTYIKYPYSKEEIEYFVIESVLEFESSYYDYEKFFNSLKDIIVDNNLREEIINFIPEICTENAFKDVIFDDRVNVNLNDKTYTMLKTQFTSYRYIEDALIDGFSNNIFKNETFNHLVHLSNSYNIIHETIQNNPDISMNEIHIISTFYFNKDYQYI